MNKKKIFVVSFFVVVFILLILFLKSGFNLYKGPLPEKEKEYEGVSGGEFQGAGLDFGGWEILNGGSPIDLEPGTIEIKATASNDGVYYFLDSEFWDFVAGRLNLQTMQWEFLSDKGWENKKDVLPRPLSLTESVLSLKSLNFKQGTEIIGIFQGQSKVLPTNLDVHGAVFSFILDQSGLRMWQGGKKWENYGAQTLFNSWIGSNGDIASNGADSAIVVGTFGCGSINCPTPTRIAAVRYNPGSLDSDWEIWKGNQWGSWTSEYMKDYSPIPYSNPPQSYEFLNPKIDYREAAQDYVLIYTERTTQRACAALYKDNKWLWWNGADWTSVGEFSCYDITNGNIGNILQNYKLVSVGKDISLIFYNVNLYEAFYNDSKRTWSLNKILGQGVTKFIAKENNGEIWAVYALGNEIYALKKINGLWQNPEKLFSVNFQNAEIKDLVFFGNNAIAFVLEGEPKRAYAYSMSQIADVPIKFGIQSTENLNIDITKIFLSNKWKDDVNGIFYSGGLSGALARDGGGSLYSPDVVYSDVRIHHAETEDPNDGNFWGGFWDYFYFPSAVEVYNKGQRVYVADFISEGGAGGTYSGRIQVVNLNYKNQNLWKKSYGGKPPGSPPPPVNLPSFSGFRFPVDLAIDEENKILFVSDSLNHKIKKYDLSAPDAPSFIGEIGRRGVSDGEFILPQGIDVDKEGNLYVADAGNHRIQKFDKNGNFLKKWGVYGRGEGQILYPYALSVDKNYSLVYLTDPYNQKVIIYTKEGEFLEAFSSFGEENFGRALGGVVGYGDGSFAVSHMPNYGYLLRFNITNLADNDKNNIPDVLEKCSSTGCDGVCPKGCSHEQDPDCGQATCNDNCKNGNELGKDCGGNCVLQTPEICNNLIDDNKDCLIDCADSQCKNEQRCQCWNGFCVPYEKCGADCTPEPICYDSVDNDEDGKVDCSDQDCDGKITNLTNRQRCEFGKEKSCADGIDNDGDGLIDCADSSDCSITLAECKKTNNYGSCIGKTICSNGVWSVCNAPTPEKEICNDNKDNDCDNLTDYDDPECFYKSCIPDLNKNRYIDNFDMDLFSRNLNTTNCTYSGNQQKDWCNFSDFNRDGTVDKKDEGIILYLLFSDPGECNCTLGPELCDGYDSDCDSLIDEGCSCINMRKSSCENQKGVCNGSIRTCYNGAWRCNVIPGEEKCDDLDNDCDGLIDEECSPIPKPEPQNTSKNCTINWTCSEWGLCIDGNQRRTCYDKNSCGVNYGKPNEIRECQGEIEKNQSDNPKQFFPSPKDFVKKLKEILIKSFGKNKYRSIFVSLAAFIFLTLILTVLAIFRKRKETQKSDKNKNVVVQQ